MYWLHLPKRWIRKATYINQAPGFKCDKARPRLRLYRTAHDPTESYPKEPPTIRKNYYQHGTRSVNKLQAGSAHAFCEHRVGSVWYDSEGRPAVEDGVRKEERVRVRRIKGRLRLRIEDGVRDVEGLVAHLHALDGRVVPPGSTGV